MDDSHGGATHGTATEDLILRTIAAHADSLLRTARRHSICVDDAQDAYQRSIEIFMGHAHRLDPARAGGWLHVVVKREAQALRRARHELLTTTEIDLDNQQASTLPTPEEQVLSFDMIGRSAEALKRVKPHELRALWLRAQGHSYSDIGAITGWSYSKVNRCLAEGRRSFLERYDGIESGAECERWLPVISALADGEATPEQILDLRPHLRNCPGCRSTLKALRDSSTPLAALLPVPLAAVDPGAGEHAAHVLLRTYEAIAGGLHERAIHSVTKAQMLLEASASGKVAAVAASAAAVAGGGYASVEQVPERPDPPRRVAKAHVRDAPTVKKAASWKAPAVAVRAATRVPASPSASPAVSRSSATGGWKTSRRPRPAPEFRAKRQWGSTGAQAAFVAQAPAFRAAPPPAPTARRSPAPEFAPRGSAPEFAAASGSAPEFAAASGSAPEFTP